MRTRRATLNNHHLMIESVALFKPFQWRVPVNPITTVDEEPKEKELNTTPPNTTVPDDDPDRILFCCHGNGD